MVVKRESYLLISDIHMSNRLAHARPGPDGVTDRLQDQLGLWRRVDEAAEEHDCKAVVVAGDLFDKSLVDAITLTETVGALSAVSRRRKLYILPGNHDAINTRGGRFTVEAFGKMGNDNIVYLPTGQRLSIGGSWLGFWPLEYCDQDTAMAHIEAMQEKVRAHRAGGRRTTEVLLLHHSILGCEFSADWRCDDGLDPELICREFNFAISGHFHKTQTFGPLDQGFYLGAPLHLHWDDVGRKAGFWIVTYGSDGSMERKFIPGGCPRFHEYDWPSDGPKSVKVGDYVRYNVEATATDWETMRPAVQAEVDEMKAKGVHANFKYKPLYPHLRRIAGVSSSTDGKMKPEAMAEAYLNSPSVDKGGLDKTRLSRIAREALEAARAKAKGSKWAE